MWNDNTIVVPLVKKNPVNGLSADKLSLLITQTNRLDVNPLVALDERIGFGVEFTVSKYLTLTPNYLFQTVRTLGSSWSHRHWLRFDATVGKSWKSISVRDRTRIERNVRQGNSDVTRLRNRPMIRVPVHNGDKKLFDVYAFGEATYDLSQGRLATTDLSTGISKPLTDHLTADFYFLHRDLVRSTRRDINAIGVNLRIRLD